MKTGIYYDISNHDYHHGEGISKSNLDAIEKSPAYYQWLKTAPIDEEKSKELDTGTALHSLVLEYDSFVSQYAVAPDVDRRTNAGKAKWEEFIQEHTGKVILTADEHRKLILLRDSLMAHPVANKLLDFDGHNEASIYWNDSETGVLCRCRPDRLIQPHHFIIDLKTSAEFERMQSKFYEYRYHVQDAFYSDGYKSHFGETPTFCFVIVSTTADCARYPVTVVTLDSEAKQAGREAYKRNLQTYSECLRTDEWSGIQTLSLPHWARGN